MKIRIELDKSLTSNEVIIHCNELSAEVQKLYQVLQEFNTNKRNILFYKKDTEYYIPLDEILFFETDQSIIMAHT